MNIDIGEVLKENLLEKGASLVGFADLSQIDSSITNGLQYGISITYINIFGHPCPTF